MFIKSLVLLLLSAASALALVAERESTQILNRTTTCGSAFFGGCCQGLLDSMSYNADCYNATLVATNVGGSTFGPQTRYSCVTALNATQTFEDAYYAICCKYMEIYVNPIVRQKLMTCSPQGGDIQ
ncbi:uncharacterized protein LY89DRAFT_682102 [Mollisia scopiformis]|uniref:Uncharacterized protein n=1 Tax=Mollisia scopiformis TaxID=149040 RepID=A0A194XKN6_MOLSC|nr:uncharacterized protein LY89DRAFT_682102 [Mollisia scopiformis]KUJ20352.1 hypothetical protein LY89DRAFT_682102 [Mollisia scopiformis]